jgi:hypothetical protein
VWNHRRKREHGSVVCRLAAEAERRQDLGRQRPARWHARFPRRAAHARVHHAR